MTHHILQCQPQLFNPEINLTDLRLISKTSFTGRKHCDAWITHWHHHLHACQSITHSHSQQCEKRRQGLLRWVDANGSSSEEELTENSPRARTKLSQTHERWANDRECTWLLIFQLWEKNLHVEMNSLFILSLTTLTSKTSFNRSFLYFILYFML